MPDGGPRGGERYRDDWQPVIGVLWDELDRNHWKEVAVTGPVQASKSFGALVVPTLRDIVELKYSPILGVPEADMFADKWDRDFKPVLESSHDLRWLLPEVGSGQRGGRVRDRVTFGNGTDLKVMSRGGQSTNKAGYTTPRLRITEAAGFSEASTSDRDEEADTYRQLVSRLGAFDLMDPRRLVLIEGTGTIADHLPWRLRGADDDERLISTRSRLVSPCPHCEAWISPEREHLVGWQNAESVMQAYEQARFVCPECGLEIDDEQRRAAMQDVRIVHYGQEITPGGNIVGDLPPVFRLWFRWSAWHNCLVNAGTVAAAEWEADQIEEGTSDRENAERDLCQKKWAVPFVSTLADQEPLKAQTIRKKTDQWPRNILPPDTRFLTVGCDLGDWTGWWFSIAWRECGELYCPAYGAFDVKRTQDDDIETRFPGAISEFIEEVIEPGFFVEGGGNILPDAVWFDCGYRPDDVASAIRSRGKVFANRYRACRGRGASVRGRSGAAGAAYQHPKKVTTGKPRIGTQWFMEINHERRIPEITFNADYWKLYLDSRLRAMRGCKGALSFYRADSKNEHAKVSNHLANEQFIKTWKPGVGLVEEWVLSGDNHWKDAAAMACAAGDSVGFRLQECETQEDEAEIEEASEPERKDDFYSDFYSRMLR